MDLFSINKNLKYYKPTLVSTQNVDRLVPFKHSNNLRGDSMMNLRPVFTKIYKNSVKPIVIYLS